jgi:hypothetical protein
VAAVVVVVDRAVRSAGNSVSDWVMIGAAADAAPII